MNLMLKIKHQVRMEMILDQLAFQDSYINKSTNQLKWIKVNRNQYTKNRKNISDYTI